MAVTRRKCFDVFSIILSCLLNCSLIMSTDNECLNLTSCSCKFKNGSIIDLSSITHADGFQWFGNATNPTDHSTYYFNPCHGFNLGNDCSQVTVCQKQAGIYYPLGKANAVLFNYNNTINRLEMKYRMDREDRVTDVILICSNGPPKFQAKGETNPGISKRYTMTLSSKCACPDGCSQSGADGLSTGSVLIILLVIFSSIYFLGGMAYLKIVRGASGFEMIPNFEFWLDFPLLVRDGVIFVLSGCRAETTYERI